MHYNHACDNIFVQHLTISILLPLPSFCSSFWILHKTKFKTFLTNIYPTLHICRRVIAVVTRNVQEECSSTQNKHFQSVLIYIDMNLTKWLLQWYEFFTSTFLQWCILNNMHAHSKWSTGYSNVRKCRKLITNVIL